MTKAEVCKKLKNDIRNVRGYLDDFDFDVENLGLEEIRKATIEQSEFIQDKIDEFYLGQEAQMALNIYQQGIDMAEQQFSGAEKEQKLKELKNSRKKMLAEERAKGIPYFLQETYD